MSSVELKPAVGVDDQWRTWIAENIMLGNAPEGIHERMVHAGIAHNEAVHEITLALSSPYVAGARRLWNRMAKHDWVLDTQRQMNRLRPAEVPRRHKLSREEFLESYYSAGRPVIITGMLDDWPALKRWDLDYLKNRCGDREVEIQYGRHADKNFEQRKEAHRTNLPFGDYVELVRSAGRSNDFYMTAYNEGKNSAALAELWDDIVQIPEYLTSEGQSKGFLWFGPAGTLTPLHHDLTNNFMAQVVGSKRVRMIPACEIGHVYNHQHCFSNVDLLDVDLERFPQMRDVSVLDCIIKPGDLLFLPVGCWHHVEGLETSLTVTFTNFLWDNDFTGSYPSSTVF